jgi:hypothetical protein
MYKYIAFPLAIIFSQMIFTTASAQKVNVWKGGAPGHETEWNFSKNWSLGRVPDEFHFAIIPDVSTGSRKYPVIKSGTIELYGLDIQSNATLTLDTEADVLATYFNCTGTCQGCNISNGVLISGERYSATSVEIKR